MPPDYHSKGVIRFDTTFKPVIRPRNRVQSGRIAFKPAVDLHPCSFLPDYGFYSLVNTSNRLSASARFMRCVLSKNGLLSAWADWISQPILSFFIRQCKQKLHPECLKRLRSCSSGGLFRLLQRFLVPVVERVFHLLKSGSVVIDHVTALEIRKRQVLAIVSIQ